jgi:hypothetical protein
MPQSSIYSKQNVGRKGKKHHGDTQHYQWQQYQQRVDEAQAQAQKCCYAQQYGNPRQ